MTPTNTYGIPADKWNRLGENQEAFNTLYGKIIARKSEFLKDVTTDQRSEFTPLFDKVVLAVCETAVQELHHA